MKKKSADPKEVVMTPRQFAAEIRNINEKYVGDIEIVHYRCDDLMCDLLKSLGYGAGVQAFKDLYKQYS